MNTDEMKKMRELIDIINDACVMYYQNSTPIMSDFEYDKLYDELVLLENKTNFIYDDSPTINVETTVSSTLEKVAHEAPMLSLSKTKKVSELIDFLGDKLGLLSWKLDGLTIVLTYDHGKLISGVTRGNGLIGEVITKNVKMFKNIPLEIPYQKKLILRGEAVIKYSQFYEINSRLNDESMQFKNPRNLCSGSVRQLDSKVTKERNVNCFIFSLVSADDVISNSQNECFEWLKKQGFEVVEHFLVNKNNMAEMVEQFQSRITENDIPSDGLVLTFDDIDYGKSLGITAKYPRHSIAFKWFDETYDTILKDVLWSNSRTGLINPVAIFDPVEIDGTTVTKASLHNLSIIENLKIGLNDSISVYKANMIIPQIAENKTQSNNLEIPKYCPICNAETVISKLNDSAYLICPNQSCPAKFSKKLSLFVSRNAMNIEGLSEAILNRFIDENYIRSYDDIYHLNRYKNEIINLDGFGDKSYQNIINSIEKSRNVNLANFIYSLGIPQIGLSRAKLICKTYQDDFHKIRNLTFEELSAIDGVGEVIAKEWISAFLDEEFNYDVDKLLKEVTFIKLEQGTKLNKMNFVITGSLNNFQSRDDLIDIIEKNGGKVLKAISNNVTYLINNDLESNSTKNREAKNLNIPIISEEAFMAFLK